MTKIPIFRAKKIDSDKYVVGYYSSAYDIHHYIITHLGVDTKANAVYQMSTDIYKIDPTTLSIHFKDMTDSQGNKIFASLSEDGKGGDILKTRGNEAPCKFNKGFTIETIMGISNLYMLLDKVKVIGIQE